MKNIDKYKNQIRKVESLVVKLESRELNLEELNSLERLTRVLHERSVILRYKALEQKSTKTIDGERLELNRKESEKEIEAKMEFRLFNNEENTVAENSDPIIDELKEESQDNSLNASFKGSKIQTLFGAFGLNEKLRYINELFNGSSELFSSTIKDLDVKSTMEEAKEIILSLAKEYEWNMEEETVKEFMEVLSRRYA